MGSRPVGTPAGRFFVSRNVARAKAPPPSLGAPALTGCFAKVCCAKAGRGFLLRSTTRLEQDVGCIGRTCSRNTRRGQAFTGCAAHLPRWAAPGRPSPGECLAKSPTLSAFGNRMPGSLPPKGCQSFLCHGPLTLRSRINPGHSVGRDACGVGHPAARPDLVHIEVKDLSC